ncbi:hypothetical protein IscW_ISCW012244 [Ixodes scapularis]|uniref:Uncharacterized protein n=1 Tax=Ixodes scapularis TaxID=6945 RepID=B7QCP9_IXOSC|nr:hypothetical protein IscW_ISCW012244 [Ixodes scapularis]|eukprot:XP_002413313.1 hypothetical protein IscW_ISCW012244 [Ixodes scapularis]
MQTCKGRAALSDYFKCGLDFNRRVKKFLAGGKTFKARRAYSRKKGKRGSRRLAKPVVIPKGAFRRPLQHPENQELC